MKKLVSILMILLFVIMPIVYSKEVQIDELFETEYNVPEAVEIDSGEAKTYFYAGSKLVASKDPLARSRDDLLKYHYQNKLGSDIDGKQLPFGQELIDSGERFEFTGKELDDDSGLNHFGARYYDPSIGKFLSVDPVEDEPAYNYVHNDPMNALDPDGTRTARDEIMLYDASISASSALISGILRGDSIWDITKNTVIAGVAGAGIAHAKFMVGEDADFYTRYDSANIDKSKIFLGRLLGDFSSSVAGNAIGNRGALSYIEFGMGPVNLYLEEGKPGANIDALGLAGFVTAFGNARGNLDTGATGAAYHPVFTDGFVSNLGFNFAGNIVMGSGKTDVNGDYIPFSGIEQGGFNHEMVHTIQYAQMRNTFRGIFGGNPAVRSFWGLPPIDFTSLIAASVVSGSAGIHYLAQNGYSNSMQDPHGFYFSDSCWWERQVDAITGPDPAMVNGGSGDSGYPPGYDDYPG